MQIISNIRSNYDLLRNLWTTMNISTFSNNKLLLFIFFNRKFVQVVGKVKSNVEIEAHYIIPGDDNFSMENYNTAVTLSHSDKFKDLFQ